MHQNRQIPGRALVRIDRDIDAVFAQERDQHRIVGCVYRKRRAVDHLALDRLLLDNDAHDLAQLHLTEKFTVDDLPGRRAVGTEHIHEHDGHDHHDQPQQEILVSSVHGIGLN